MLTMRAKDLFGVALHLQHCIACIHGSRNAITLLQALRDDAELRRKQEIHEAEESKNAHIQDLMKKHEKVLLQCDAYVHNYYVKCRPLIAQPHACCIRSALQ